MLIAETYKTSNDVRYTIEDVFDNWIRASNSESTKKNYSQVVAEFFEMMFGKKINEVIKNDIDNLNPIGVNTLYVTELSKRNSQSTIRYKMDIVLSFMEELKSARYDIDMAYISRVLSTKRIKKDTKLINFMSVNDYHRFKDWLEYERFSEGRFPEKGAQYAMLLEFMWSTGSRITAVFNTKWSDIKYDEDAHGQFGYSIYILDKGDKLNWKPVSEEFYNKLTSVMFEGNEEETIFQTLSQKKFSEYMKEFFGDRKITPHSIKKGAVSYYYYTTKDIVGAQDFGDHESIVTTRRYIESPQDRMKQGSSVMTDKQANLDSLKELSIEQVLSIMEDRKDLMFGLYYEAKTRDFI